MKIVLTGGGTGGHLFPLVAVRDYINKNYKNTEKVFIFYGPKGKLESDIIESRHIKSRHILSGKLRRYFSLYYCLDLIKLPLGFLQAMFYLLVDMPDVIFAKGGYASVPVVTIAWLYRIPILVHESDSRPGIANQFLGSIATKVALSFRRARIHFPPSKTILTGTPVAERVLNGNKEEAIKILNIKRNEKPALLILGGSQGAMFINRRILRMLKVLIKEYQVVHQTGENNFDWVVQEAEKIGVEVGTGDYYPVAFFDENIKHFYALADVVISRAGSTTISEIAANKKPAILVPITRSANNHQRLNAFEVSKKGGAIVLEENNFKTNLVRLRLRQLVEDGVIRENIVKNVQKFYNPKATELLAKEIISMGER